MAQVNVVQQNWAGGELSPKMRGRYDLPVYVSGAERIVNFIAEPAGPARFRPGFVFVSNTRRNNIARFIPFQFNDSDTYQLEFTENYIRFYQNDDIVTLAAKTITGATAANPVVVTSAAHGYSNGDEIIISGVVGMIELNGRNFVVQNVTANTFQLYDSFGTGAINGTAYTAYTSGGIAEKILEVATPYLTADLFKIKFAQNADTMYITHRLYAPYKLVRSGALSWAMGTFVRTGDPFTGAGYFPRTCCFFQGRLVYGYSDAFPESIWGSKPLDASGNPQYDDLTVGATATDAYKFTIAPMSGKVVEIQSIIPTLNFLAIGAHEGIFKADGGQAGDPLSPSAVNITPAVTQGCVEEVVPFLLGINLVYIHRSGLTMFSLEYDIFFSAYNAIDKNLSNEHINESGIIQMVYQNGRPPIFWLVRNDGVLVGITFNLKENVNGGHRHILGGTNPATLSVGISPRLSQFDRLWIVSERTINGQTVRYVEYQADDPIVPEPQDFYTGDANEDSDLTIWRNAMFEAQKQFVNVDAALTFDGSIQGLDANVSVTPGAVSGTSVTFTASAAIFTAGMVGQEIWKKAINGIGTGRAKITGFTSSTIVTCQILSDFNSVNIMQPGYWYLTATVLRGLNHLEGESVAIVTDGGEHPNKTVTNGKITLDYQASMIHVGLKYTGLLKSMNIEAGGVNGPSQGKQQNVNNLGLKFSNTLGARYGTSLYNMEEIEFRTSADDTGRPPPLFSDIVKLPLEDTTDYEKHIYIQQTHPLPCTVLEAIPFIDTDNG